MGRQPCVCGVQVLGWVPRTVGVADRAGEEEEEERGLPSGSGGGRVGLVAFGFCVSVRLRPLSAVLPLYGRFRPVLGDAAVILTRISTLNQSMAGRIVLLVIIDIRTLLFVKKMKV